MATSAPTSTSQHAGKTVLVTGGGGGLGRVVVEHFLSLGANVVTCDINTDLLADLEVKVTSAYPEQVLALKLDITSVAAFKGGAAGAAYTASKHGILGLTRNTAAFYHKKGIRCNAIQAGAMNTNIGSSMAAGVNQQGMELSMKLFENPVDYLVDLHKMAKLIAYLCSDDASMLNGAVVTADMGATAI